MPDSVNLASDAVFARVRGLLRQSQYNEDTAEQRVVDKEIPYPPYPGGRIPDDADAPGILIGLFLRGSRATQAQLDSLSPDAGADFLELGIIARAEDGVYRPSVRIRPMYGLYVISDLWEIWDASSAGGKKPDLPDDVVFPPDIPNTLTYLSYIPLNPCERFLEGCGGSGVAALIMAHAGCGHAYSFDITERSTQYARFSARLNGFTNFTAAQGDTWEPAGGMQFDRIALHPPYVPVLKHTWIYHAGGNDGEQVTRNHIQQLHKVLAPGGRLYCRCLGSDREGSPFEKRIREWLGEHSDEFDVAMHVIRVLDPLTYVMASVLRGRTQAEELEEWSRLFTALKLFRFLQCVVVIQRRAESRPVFTIRRGSGPCSGPRELEWALHWETLRMKGCAGVILDSKLQAGAVSLEMKHQIQNGNWAVVRQELEVQHPYYASIEVDPLAAYIVPKCDGTKTGRQVFDSLLSEGAFSGTADPNIFADSMAGLVSSGFVVVEGHTPPEPMKRTEEEI